MLRYKYEIPDYEHSGDLQFGISEIKSAYSKATNFRTYEERDSEAEWDYKDEYGEEDCEPIYRGFVEFDAPDSYRKAFEDTLNCYVIKG